MATLSQVIVPSNIATSTNTLTMSNKTLIAPVISGGTINNATIGATTPTTAAFTVATVNGVQFPATQVSSADANQLDDYEEGTFTPAISGTTTAGTGTYSIQQGKYTKIGNLFSFYIYLTWSTHTGTGNMTVTGLPFSVASGPAITVFAWHNQLSLTASNVIQPSMTATTSTITIQQIPVGGGVFSAVPMDTNTALILSGSYTTAT